MKSIITKNYPIHFNNESYKNLNSFLNEQAVSKLFVLVDTNTHEHCLAYFLAQIQTEKAIEIIEIEAGEHHKNIDTCVGVWNALSELNADRKSIILNLGGGIVTDLGGFVASTFKRGMRFINIPTSLLAMVDASVGGKTGVDLNNLKNQIGVINYPEMVLIDTQFLDSLPQNQMRSGLAEMLKHGLIKDDVYWNKLNDLSALSLNDLDDLIHESVVIKNTIVTKDPNEENIRKTLNFGHTLGHAIETYFLNNNSKADLLHGEAIAIGMVLATYISTQLTGFPETSCLNIKQALQKIYGKVEITDTDYMPIIELLKFDKKNTFGKINFVLLENIGKPLIDQQVSNELIIKSFKYYAF